jgi:hypothetical protein
MADQKAEHVTNPDESCPHVRVQDSTEGGACLTGHETDYKPNSCSYRWQALTDSKLNRKTLLLAPTLSTSTEARPQRQAYQVDVLSCSCCHGRGGRRRP